MKSRYHIVGGHGGGHGFVNLTMLLISSFSKSGLIAMMGVIMARQSPGCAIVTDSVTSTGLSSFLEELGLLHVRYVRGYANVIRKARSLTESNTVNAEVAIETSGQ